MVLKKDVALMNRHETFRTEILKRISTCSGSLNIKTSQMAVEFGIAEGHVREELVIMLQQRRIALTAWDGERELPYAEWPDADSFFFNRSDAGYVRIRLLSAGAELLSELPKAPIGSAAASR
jgi:hypothetical protein